MFGIIYLILSGWIGYEAVERLLFPGKKQWKGIHRTWLVLPAAFGCGTLFVTWMVYILSWIASVCFNMSNPLLVGNFLVMGMLTVIFAGMWIKKKRVNFWREDFHILLNEEKGRKEIVLFAFLLAFISFMMYYVFHISGGNLYSGFTVYGDYAPHTAMMRSFSRGNNFPTQYPHFGGEDIKYHFMFQFLVGNLEYLGLRIDLAYNIVSVAALLGFLMLLYQIALRITKSGAAAALTVIFFFFRSGMAFFRFAWEHILTGDLWNVLKDNTAFIGYTVNENWGLWNFNVYLNQRHLAFGLLIISLAVWIYMDWLDAGLAHQEKGTVWLKGRIFSAEAWKSRDIESALLLGVLLGFLAFWNGAALVGGLLILFGFAAFSDGKLDYAVTAAIAVSFSFIQTKIFIRGSSLGTKIYLGFLADEKNLWGVIKYLFWMGGIFFLGLIVFLIIQKRRERVLLTAFLLPVIFAFTMSLTPDINVNHKYIMIAYAFLEIFWAWAVVRIFRRGKVYKAAAILLALCLTATGIYDFVVILKANGKGRRVAVRTESTLTDWLSDNLKKDDLILTPEYSMNEVTMSGAMMYCGWPYYAWSAGYDTNYRAAQAVIIYTTTDPVVLEQTVEQEHITYIVYEENMEFEQQQCREDVIASVYQQVFCSDDGNIRIYDTRQE